MCPGINLAIDILALPSMSYFLSVFVCAFCVWIFLAKVGGGGVGGGKERFCARFILAGVMFKNIAYGHRRIKDFL